MPDEPQSAAHPGFVIAVVRLPAAGSGFTGRCAWAIGPSLGRQGGGYDDGAGAVW
jgi:hypothetical protein